MSIYIHMDIPKSCWDCPFHEDDVCYPGKMSINRDHWNDRSPHCPLIEVPEHGRLIDADALDDVVRIRNKREYETGAYITRTDYKIISSVLFEFPAIIPADKETET